MPSSDMHVALKQCRRSESAYEQWAKCRCAIAIGIPYHMEGGIIVVGAQILHKACKAFVQPQSVPPCHGHQVTKPLHTEQGE